MYRTPLCTTARRTQVPTWGNQANSDCMKEDKAGLIMIGVLRAWYRREALSSGRTVSYIVGISETSIRHNWLQPTKQDFSHSTFNFSVQRSSTCSKVIQVQTLKKFTWQNPLLIADSISSSFLQPSSVYGNETTSHFPQRKNYPWEGSLKLNPGACCKQILHIPILKQRVENDLQIRWYRIIHQTDLHVHHKQQNSFPSFHLYLRCELLTWTKERFNNFQNKRLLDIVTI